MVIANQKCTQFFDTMRADKEKALLSPPFEFEVCIVQPLQAVLPHATCSAGMQTTPCTYQSCTLNLTCCVCQVLVKHKYGAVLNCKVSIKFSGAEDLRLLSCTFALAGDNARMGLITAGESWSRCQQLLQGRF